MANDWFIPAGRKLFATLIAVVMLAGCARTEPISYYQLSSRQDAAGLPGGGLTGESFTLGLGPVQLPEYLERIQLVNRTSANRLQIVNSQRWAEPLAAGLPRVLGEDLALLLGNARILNHPWPRSRPVDRQVVVNLLQFEGGHDGTALLTARWTVLDGAGTVLLDGQRSRFQVAATPGAESLTAALSEAIWLFAGEIAAALANLAPDS